MISLCSMIAKPAFFSVPCRKQNGNIWTINNKNTAHRPAAPPTHNPFLSQQLADPNPALVIQRRSGNYEPPLWGFQDIQSLNSEYSGERYSSRVSELKERVSKMMLELENAAPVDQLEFIDDLQRLGISYHFEDEVKKMLSRAYTEKKDLKNDINVLQEKDLYNEALAFRLFRQHGFMVSQDAFDSFKDLEGKFSPTLKNDIKGLLQLYEASYTLAEGESSLEQAIEFTTLALQEKLDSLSHNTIDQKTASIIRHALELPFHWKAERPNTKSYIQEYERRPDMNLIVLQFAKLDFNVLQSTYQQELKHVSRWWEKTGLIEKLPFARDRVVEAYFWAAGFLYEPQYRYYRVMITKLINFIALLDDIYDVYGTLEELQEFTKIIQRWDTDTYELSLPEYMQVFWRELNNFIDDSVNYVLNSQGFDITPYLRKTWTDYSNVNLQEATWYYQGHTPTMEEYMEGAWFSVSGPVVLTHAFFLAANPVEEEVVRSLYKYHDIVWSSSMIFRLLDDWGTSPEEMKRGDVPKLIQCYMNETGATEIEAREYIRCLICETWKKMNKESSAGVAERDGLPTNFIRSVTGLARMSRHVYYNGDGFGGHSVKDHISDMVFQPIDL